MVINRAIHNQSNIKKMYMVLVPLVLMFNTLGVSNTYMYV